MNEQKIELLSVQDVCRMLGCSRRTVYRLKDSGQMPPSIKIGGMVRWRPDEIQSWINDGCPETRARNPRHNKKVKR